MKTLASLLRISLLVVLFTALFWAYATMAQTETGTISGLITDETGAAVAGAEVQLLNVQRGTTSDAKTNSAGIYIFNGVQPGQYQIKVQKPGFKQVDLLSLIVNVQDHIEQNVRLQVGSVSESVTVNADDLHINTTDATVSTVVDRQFAENLPLNGRSFQTLIQLTPGVVLTTSNWADSGQFSVNGQRATANYWMVDGVSANIGVGVSTFRLGAGNGLAGALGPFSASGGTNSLVSVDALQEFRILTSTYAPEFGRTPGGQISIATRSGTNQFHGTVFEYFRNDILDANNWFNTSVTPSLPKAKERQNDFGGTFAGPLRKKKTFFFFSYEGLRLRLPQTELTTVPDLNARQNAIPAIQPYLNAFPFDPNQASLGNGIASFNASFSNPASLDAYSLRIDHKLNEKLTLFGRYNYSPSELTQRGSSFSSMPLSDLSMSQITTQTATMGVTWAVSPVAANDLRFNYSRTNAFSNSQLDNFGGAVPLTSLPLPNSLTAQNAHFDFGIFSLLNGFLDEGTNGRNIQRQINIVDNLSVQRGSHALKFGVDFRRLAPIHDPQLYYQEPGFLDVASAESGKLFFSFLISNRNVTFQFRNLGMFAQDTWRLLPRLRLTYGFRWDIDFVPTSIDGPSFPAATGFNMKDLSQLALAPAGTPPFKTKYNNIAPRIGAAYQLTQNQNWGTVLRGGFGIFYDLADGELGNLLTQSAYPFAGANFNCCFNGTFPLDSATAAPPPIVPPGPRTEAFTAFDPNLKLPYTLQWNVALEQALGTQQAISVSYIGAVGRRLIQTADIFTPNPNLAQAVLVTNGATSDYDALQVQFQRRLSHGLQALASYTWSHSIDTASAGSAGFGGNTVVPALSANANRGPSDFDIRNAFSAGVTYSIPAPKINFLSHAILGGWSLQNVIQARSAPPVDVYSSVFGFMQFKNAFTLVRPDAVPGVPFYLYGPQYPAGKAINNTPGAVAGGCPDGSQSVGPFCPPATGQQGNLGRNALRGFGATQWDFAIHREFPIHEQWKLQFRAEMFNVLNHPNFGQPLGDLSNSSFGRSTQLLGQSLDQNVGAGSFSALYQIGGPRSIQFGLRLAF